MARPSSSPPTAANKQNRRSTALNQLNQPFSNCRAITMRWIWLVPSQIWVIVDRVAVSAGRSRAGWLGVSTDSAPVQDRPSALGAVMAEIACERRVISATSISLLPVDVSRLNEQFRRLPAGTGRVAGDDMDCLAGLRDIPPPTASRANVIPAP
jgi:hypothetical protein